VAVANLRFWHCSSCSIKSGNYAWLDTDQFNRNYCHICMNVDHISHLYHEIGTGQLNRLRMHAVLILYLIDFSLEVLKICLLTLRPFYSVGTERIHTTIRKEAWTILYLFNLYLLYAPDISSTRTFFQVLKSTLCSWF